jgi:hypothetical protein
MTGFSRFARGAAVVAIIAAAVGGVSAPAMAGTKDGASLNGASLNGASLNGASLN